MEDCRRLRENAGTHLLEKCSHDIDLVNWIVNDRAKRAASFGGLDFFLPRNAGRINQIPPQSDGKNAYCAMGGLIALNPFTSDKDIIDNQVEIIEYGNGCGCQHVLEQDRKGLITRNPGDRRRWAGCSGPDHSIQPAGRLHYPAGRIGAERVAVTDFTPRRVSVFC